MVPAALLVLLFLPLAWAEFVDPTHPADSSVILTDPTSVPSPDPAEPPPTLPGFSFTPWWSEDNGLVAVWDADLKANVPDWAGEDSDCGLSSSAAVWPMAPGYTLAGGYTAGTEDPSLNDPARTIELLQRNQIDLYLHDARSARGAGHLDDDDFLCDWRFLAALNDAIDEADAATFPPFDHVLNTGMILNNIEADTNVFGSRGTGTLPTNSGEDVGMCYYRDWIARARGEAYEHPFHRVVIVDELAHSLASPFDIWQGNVNIWDREDVEELRTLATETDAAAVDSTRRICDARWAGEVPTYPDPALEGLIPAPEDPQIPVELWARVNVAQAPLYFLPSFMLGVPYGGSFSVGDTYLARWMVTPLSFPDPMSVGRITLRYFTTTYDITNDHPITPVNWWLTLGAKAKNTDTSSSVLHTIWGPDTTRNAEAENIYLIETVLYDPASPAPPGGWSWAGGAPTPIDIRLQAQGTTNPTAMDRVFLIWGIEIRYEQPELTGPTGGSVDTTLPRIPLATQSLSVEDAVGIHRSAAGTESPCSAPAVCRSNADLRIDHLLDGVSFAQDVQAEWPDPASWAHAPLHQAWAAFIDNACDHLSTAHLGGGPVHCLVDERAWVSDTTLLPELVPNEAIDRVHAGLEQGDGAIVTWLTLEMEDMIDQTGRFGERDPYFSDYPYTAYLPRLTRNMLGESILWEVTPDLVTYPECAGEWTILWEADGCPNKWTYGPVGEGYLATDGLWRNAIDYLDDYAFYQLVDLLELGAGSCSSSATTPISGSFAIDLGAEGYSALRFGWEIKDDRDPVTGAANRTDVGESQDRPQMFRFAIVPPAGCPDPDSSEVAQVAEWSPELFEFYDGITCLLQGEDPTVCGGTP